MFLSKSVCYSSYTLKRLQSIAIGLFVQVKEEIIVRAGGGQVLFKWSIPVYNRICLLSNLSCAECSACL